MNEQRPEILIVEGQLICPTCGANEFSFREEHTVSCPHDVGEIVNGALQIEADYEHSPFGDVGTGENPFLECQECDEIFQIPAGLKLEFVDRL
jgi:hypothetical protein